MDRPTVFVDANPRALDFLRLGQFAMVGLAKLSEAVLGTSTVVDGFTLAPTAPASLSVILSGGSLYEQETLEATQWSVMPTDSHTIVKQGIQLDPTTFTVAPPSTTGYAQCFLVEASFQESDTGTTVLNYYNAANPAVPFTGAGNSGASDNTIRKGGIAIQVKAGIAAAAGTQVVPSPDAGWVGLYYVTLAAGATTVTAGNITAYPGAPFLAAKLGQMPAYIQGDVPVYCIDQGAVANKLVVTPNAAFGAYLSGQRLRVKMTRLFTGPGTINVSGLGELAITRRGGVALIGGEWAVGDYVDMVCRGTDWQLGGLSATDAPSNVHTGLDTGSTASQIVLTSVTGTIPSNPDSHIFVIATIHACTGATTAIIPGLNGGAAVSIVRNDGSALQSGDWAQYERIMLVSDGVHLRLVRLTINEVISQLAPLIPTLAPSISPPRNIWARQTAGTYSFTVGTDCPATVTQVLVTDVGAGGGGAGGGGSSTWSGGGGGGGGTSIGWMAVTNGQVLTVVVGAGGAGSAQGNGVTATSGGTSSVGTMSATGGAGGQAGTATSSGGAPGVGSGGQINLYGSVGGDGNDLSQNSLGGGGGASSLGGGGRTSTVTGPANATTPGSGGGGIWQSGGTSYTGGRGADGYVSIQY